MNLFKLADSGTYYVRVKINKKSYRESLDTTNQKVAMTRLRDWLIEHSLSKPLSGSPNSLASLVEEYLARLASDPNVAPRTRDYKQEQTETLVVGKNCIRS
jgi:hypothetical protein